MKQVPEISSHDEELLGAQLCCFRQWEGLLAIDGRHGRIGTKLPLGSKVAYACEPLGQYGCESSGKTMDRGRVTTDRGAEPVRCRFTCTGTRCVQEATCFRVYHRTRMSETERLETTTIVRE